MTLPVSRDKNVLMMEIFLNNLFVAFAAVLILMPLARKAARQSGFVDVPQGRKQHHKPVPPIGGLVIFPVFIAVSLWSGADLNYFWPLYVGLGVLVFTGALDERLQIKASIKLVIQIAVALLVVLYGQAHIYQLGNLFGLGDIGLSVLSIPVSVLAVVLLINAMNLLDGLDGLAGGFAAVFCGVLLGVEPLGGVAPR